jgi:hypothetical protein
MMPNCGDKIECIDEHGNVFTETVLMTIQGRKGHVVLYKPVQTSSLWDAYLYDKQAEAIKAFMEFDRA